ncbi:MAG: PA14 domain-containing protein, partial [Vicinamibacterales bacterium]
MVDLSSSVRLRRVRHAILGFLVYSLLAPGARAQVSVTTHSYDIGRTGANTDETLLTPNNVNVTQFGKLFERTVDDQIYGQPLYVPNVNIPEVGVRNVVYVATVRNTVYAFDADTPSATAPLWQRTFVNPPSINPGNRTEVGQACGAYSDFDGNIGIVGTPVIDAAVQTMYFVTRTNESGAFVQRLHALDIATGLTRPGAPVNIQAAVSGPGLGGDVNGVIAFNPRLENQRAALLLLNGVVYIAFASYCDTGSYHGWVLGYNASTLEQVMVYNATPNYVGGGLWQSGAGLAGDASGSIYGITGNGSFDASRDRGSSFVKLAPDGSLQSSFTPYDWSLLNSLDADLAQGPLLIPNTNLMVGGSKLGRLYVVDRTNMGGVGTTNDNQIVQSFQASSANRMNGVPAYWDSPDFGPVIYYWASGDPLKAFRLVNGRFDTTPISQGTLLAPSGMPGGVLTLSANGTTPGSGIVWSAMSNLGNANPSTQPGIVRAFDAANLTRELWNSEQNAARDRLGNFSKFSPPIVANGKVYVATFSNKLVAYGLLNGGAGNQPASVSSGVDRTVTLPSTLTLSATVSDDGLPNPPGALSLVWSRVSGPGTATFSPNSTAATTVSFSAPGIYVLRLTVYDGAAFSTDDVRVDVYPAPGSGTGLQASYFNDAGTGGHFTALRLTRVDPTVDFDWADLAPDPTVQSDNFSVRWSGQVQAPVTGTYTFSTASNDGVRLWVDSTLVIDQWNDHTVQTDTAAPISLTAGVAYNISLEYYDHLGPATVQLRWAYPGQPGQVIPQGNLFPTSPSNRAPIVNSGVDQHVEFPTAAVLHGTADDDGLPNPPATLAVTWSAVSGREEDALIVFSNPHALDTTVTFPVAGTYVLRLTVNDGSVTVSDDMVVVSGANTAPIVSAGADQAVTLPAHASLTGTATDDGLPNPPGALTVQWSVVSGPGSVTFSSATSLTTSAQFTTAGTYVLRLTASDTVFSTSDDVTVAVAPVVTALNGLRGEYFNDNGTQLFTTLALTRVDPTVDFDWARNPPGAGVQEDNFSVRWTGQLLAPTTGSYTFRTISDDGVRLWVNGNQVINNWTDHDITTDTSAGVPLVAGTLYDIRLEFYDRTGEAVMQLRWALPGSATFTAIPQAQLFTPGSANQPPTVNAGPDLTITLPASATLVGSAADDGAPNPPGALAVNWSSVSGPGVVTFGTPGALTTTASFSTAGTYTLRLTVSDSLASSQDDVVVTVQAGATNQPPTANAGIDRAITLPSNVSLAGTATDDGLPNPPAALTYSWTVVSGPGAVTFGAPSVLTTTATFASAGVYTLRLAVSDSALSATDDVVVTVNPAPTNQPPTVNAGSDVSVTLPAGLTLTGVATDDGLPAPPGALTYAWSLVTGPGSVTFGSPAALTTSASFSVPGSYTIRLSVSDSALTATDDRIVTVNPALAVGTGLTGQYFNDPANTTTYFTTLALTRIDATVDFAWVRAAPGPGVQDDNFSARWTGQVVAPVTGNYTFQTVSDDGVRLWVNGQQLINDWVNHPATTRTSVPVALQAGVGYDVRLEYFEKTSAATIRLQWITPGQTTAVAIPQAQLFPVAAPQNQAPTANAGADRTITLPAGASLVGTATDDGLPNPPAALTYAWSRVSGPGTVTFGTPATLSTTAAFSAAGTYTLRLTVSDSVLSATDDVVVTVNAGNQPPTVNAGADQTITLPAGAALSGTASDDGLPSPPAALTYAWTQVSGPGTASFASSTALATTVSFTAAGSYTLRLTASDGTLSSSDDVVIVVNAAPINQAPTVNAGTDQSITLPAAATLSGTASDDGLPNPPAALTIGWSTVSGPGTVTFNAPTALLTTATFSAPGSYTLRLSVSDGDLSTTDDVIVDVRPANEPPVASAGADQTITLPAGATLNGSATDDGLPNPPASLTYAWSIVSAPGTVTFGTPSAATTAASFSAAGSYTLRLTVSDSALSATDDVVVTVNAVPNAAPTATAGADQTITLPAGATLNGSATDDGLPNPPA